LTLDLPSEKDLAVELKTIFEARLTPELSTEHVAPLDYAGLARDLLDTSALNPVKKLRIEEYPPTGTIQNTLNSSKLGAVQELNGEGSGQRPTDWDHWSGPTRTFAEIETLKRIVRLAQKAGHDGSWVFERAEEAGISDVDAKLTYLKARGTVAETSNGFILTRVGP